MRLQGAFLGTFNKSLIKLTPDNYESVGNESLDEILPSWTTISVSGDVPYVLKLWINHQRSAMVTFISKRSVARVKPMNELGMR